MSDSNLKSRIRSICIGVLLVAVVMLPRILDLHAFIGPDEISLWGWGNDFALALQRGQLSATFVGDGYPAVTLMWINTIGVGLKWLWLHLMGAGMPFLDAIGLDRPVELLAERRMFLAFFCGIQILAAFPLLRRLWDRNVAILAVVFMAIEPFSLAFTRMVRADALLSGFLWLSALATLVFVKTGRRRYNWLAGAMGGLATLSKFTGGITLVAAVGIFSVVAWQRARQLGRAAGMRWFIGAGLGWAIPMAVVIFGLWPAWWFQPLDVLTLITEKAAFHALTAADQKASVFFWGTLHEHGLGAGFYPILAALRLTPWMLLGSLAAVISGVVQIVTRQDWRAHLFGIAVAANVAVYWLSITLPGQKIDRYFLPVVPGLAILSSLVMVAALRWLRGHLPRQIAGGYVPAGALLGVSVVALAHVGAYHPLYSTYYDPLIATPGFVQWALPVGEGEGVDETLAYLSARPGAEDSSVVCGTNFPRCRPFFSGELRDAEDLRSGRWFEADYVLWHIDEQQSGDVPAGVQAYLRRDPPVYIAQYHGIDYTWLYSVPRAQYRTGGSRLEGIATLLGYDLSSPSITTDESLVIRLYWQNEGIAPDDRLFVRMVDAGGYIWAEDSATPLAGFENDARVCGQIVESQSVLTPPLGTPPGVYVLQAGAYSQTANVIRGWFSLRKGADVVTVQKEARAPSPAQQSALVMQSSLEIPLGDEVELLGFDLAANQLRQGQTNWLTLYWLARRDVGTDYVVGLQLLQGGGQEIAYWLGRPAMSSYPTTEWRSGEIVRDPWSLQLPAEVVPGRYTLRLTLYDATLGTALAHAVLSEVDVVN